MKIKFNERTGRWVPDELIDFKKLFRDKKSDFKRIVKLKFYTCWLWLYLYPYRYIKSDILGLDMQIGFEWLLTYKQLECDRFAKYKKR
jgi:hypothetical protein